MPRLRKRHTFRLKLALAVALAGLADWLFFDRPAKLGFGLYGCALILALLVAHPALRRDGRALAALAVAAGFALLMLERPTVILWLFLWAALALAALSPRAAAGGEVWRWSQRLAVAGLKSLVGPLADARRLASRRPGGRAGTRPGPAILAAVALPLTGGLVFLALFAAANPLIEQAFSRLRLPKIEPARGVFWAIVALAAWALLRPRGLRHTLAPPDARADLKFVGVSPASLTLSLVVFNALFAVQNGLDLAFLWSGAPLPEGVTLADYAHRGAYLLIVTAILAGGFVLVALRPGSETGGRPLVRRLVVLWVLQNLLLVASSALRTLDYVDAYGLTRLRIAALAWMALVAFGLVLICLRLLRGKSSSWLIDMNALAAAFVILACDVADLGAIAAAWNVRHAREVDGQGAALDVCHLRELGSSALVPLAEAEGRPLPLPLYEAVVATRRATMDEVLRRQADWRTWSWRDARRLETASDILARRPPPAPVLSERHCDGRLVRPAAPPAPLTPAPQP